jgi:altered-inheritance-of-mitochondria protein 5
VLKNVVDPEPPAPEPIARVAPAGLAEMAKDKWNRALETSLKSVYETDWKRVRENAEDSVGAVVEKIREQK